LWTINRSLIMNWQTFISTLVGGLITFSAILLTNALDLSKRKRTHEKLIHACRATGRNHRQCFVFDSFGVHRHAGVIGKIRMLRK